MILLAHIGIRTSRKSQLYSFSTYPYFKIRNISQILDLNMLMNKLQELEKFNIIAV